MTTALVHPTIEHAKARAKVALMGRHGPVIGEIVYVEGWRGRGKVRLSSGAILGLPLTDIVVLEDARAEGRTTSA